MQRQQQMSDVRLEQINVAAQYFCLASSQHQQQRIMSDLRRLKGCSRNDIYLYC